MNLTARRAVRLRVLVILCAALLAPTIAAFLVNLEFAVRALAPDWRFFELFFPEALFRLLSPLSADLSAVSTLVPVLLLAFPMAQGWRILRRQERDPEFVSRLVYDPYPPFFSFFLAMLGLEGTLYGLFLGLGISQVAELTASTLTSDAIHGTLKRLLEGTATAILSSLVGLIGAFVAARPLNWFRRIALLDEVEAVEADSLTETAHRLNIELRALGDASRAFMEELKPEALKGTFGRLDEAANAFITAANSMRDISLGLERMVAEHVRTNEQLALSTAQSQQNMAWFQAAWGSLASGLENTQEDVRRLIALGEQAQQARQALQGEAQTTRDAVVGAMSALGAEARTGTANLLASINNLGEAARTTVQATERERESLRQAIAAYLGRPPEPGKNGIHK